MYNTEQIQSRLREKPFRPLRIIVSEGLRYDIRHPDLVFVGSRDIMVGSPSAENPTVYDKVTRVALVHIVALEDLPSPSTPSNGEES
ncbi:MAG: hypothetical protein ACJ8FY_22525 [Gemmataceae bacterium]